MMSASDVDFIQSAGSPWIVPLLEVNLAKYTANLERDHRHNYRHQHRRTNPDDCCNYCEVYHDGTMSQIKQHEIDVWRREVNLTLLQQHARARSASLARHASLSTAKHNYTAPGTPDTEPGFRRVRDLNSVSSRCGGSSKQRSLSTQGRSVLSRSVDFGSLSLGTSRSARTPVTSRTHVTNGTVAERRAIIGYQPPVSSVNTSRTPSNSSTPDGDMAHHEQSTSNKLLNVITIDDYLYRSNRDQRFIGKQIRPYISNGNADSTNITINYHDRSRSDLDSFTRYASTDQETQPLKNPSTTRTNKKITTNQSNDTMPVHQRLYAGTCPKHILHDPESTKPPTESKTFRRLHRNLHRWIDDELIKPTVPKARLQAKQSHSATDQNYEARTIIHRKDSPVSKHVPSLVGDVSQLKNPQHSDSFLGMLVEMDKSTDISPRDESMEAS